MTTNESPVATLEEIFGPVIHAYTRAQAIADGTLVDVSEMAREAGFRYPVALTAAVWSDCVKWDKKGAKTYQDEDGRLWDVLWMARAAASRAMTGQSAVTVKLYRVPLGCAMPRPVTLEMLVGPGDDGEPVVTILMPDED